MGQGPILPSLPSKFLPSLPIVTWWPISTLAGKPDSREGTVVITAWSWTLVPCPMLTLLRSPRMTAPYHTETLSHSSTSPTTVADGATKALVATRGRWSKSADT